MDAIEMRADLDDLIYERLIGRLHRGVRQGVSVLVPTVEAREVIDRIASAAIAEKDRRWRRMVREELDRLAAAPTR